ALPNIVTGIRTGMGFAWRGLIAAEMIATNVGLGYMLFLARDFYRTEVIVFAMIVIGVIWLVLDRALLAPLERATVERWGLVQRTWRHCRPSGATTPAGRCAGRRWQRWCRSFR